MQLKNIAALISGMIGAAPTALVAGGAGDNTLVTGEIIDRFSIGGPQSAVLMIPYSATLAAGETLSVTYTVQEGEEDDLSDAATLKTATVVLATGPVGGGTVAGCAEISFKPRAGGRYNRVNITPDLSAANTDTAGVAAVIVYAGAERLPQ